MSVRGDQGEGWRWGEQPVDRSETQDTVVVAAGAAWDYYLRHAAYVCQEGRSFRPVERMAFYRRKRIESRLPVILDRRDHVPFTREHAQTLVATGRALDAHLAKVILDSLREGSRSNGVLHQVFLLSPPDDPRTLGLTSPIPHEGTTAWTMGQRYAAAPALSRARTTADLEPGAPPAPVRPQVVTSLTAPLSSTPPVDATGGHSIPSSKMTHRPGSALERCFVQFMHPGGEHGPDSGRLKHWNVGDHKRKFIRLEGEYLSSAEAGATPSRAELALWAEWEPESDVESLRSTVPDGPEWLHRPFYEQPRAFRRDGRVLQNTDPFVYGDRFLYTVCRQWRRTHGVYRPTFLRDLERGSLILFGSHKGGEFVLDTVFVVGDSVLHDASSWPSALASLVPDAYHDVTLRPAFEWGGGEELRLYRGATPGDPVEGMFSFVPCMPVDRCPSGFARPRIRLDSVITPTLAMGAKVKRNLGFDKLRELWSSVVEQVLHQGLSLGARLDIPDRRGAPPASSVPEYVERRLRRPKPDGCRILPSSTPVVAFGDPHLSRVATLGLNPSRIEFEVDGRELDGAERRFETLTSLGVRSLENAPRSAVEKVLRRCDDYFRGNPYRRWFDRLEEVLRAVGASYYDGTACHLDLSQWATDPTWNGLDAATRERLVRDDAAFLHEQLRTEPIELLLLNGRGVIDGFVNALGGRLTQASGVVNDGGAPTAFFIGSFEDVRVVGWSTNLQSSYGVTRVLREQIAARVRELSVAP